MIGSQICDLHLCLSLPLSVSLSSLFLYPPTQPPIFLSLSISLSSLFLYPCPSLYLCSLYFCTHHYIPVHLYISVISISISPTYPLISLSLSTSLSSLFLYSPLYPCSSPSIYPLFYCIPLCISVPLYSTLLQYCPEYRGLKKKY